MTLEDLTIGIEEEYQIIDPETRELTSFVSEFLEQGAVVFRDQVKPELLQSQVEVGSHVCRNIREARQELVRLRGLLGEIAEKNNRKIVAAGTHPFSRWQDQVTTDRDRYRTLIDNMSYVARRLLIFGMHVHVGIPDRELRIDIMNQLAYFIPHILCLSTSSPFWLGTDTGLKSYRSVVFQDLPRTGLPEYFDSAADYDNFVATLVKTGCIDEPTKIWWDIRPHPKFPTLEIRVCDCTTLIDDVISIAALLQALIGTLLELRQKNLSWRLYREGLAGREQVARHERRNGWAVAGFGKERGGPGALFVGGVNRLRRRHRQETGQSRGNRASQGHHQKRHQRRSSTTGVPGNSKHGGCSRPLG